MCTEVAVADHGRYRLHKLYPIKRMLRDTRLMMIWTGTNEIMNLIIQHGYFREVLEYNSSVHDVENDNQV